MNEYPIKYDTAPTLSISAPQCAACLVDVESEDGWLCPMCGTAWGYDAGEDEDGELYESWSGEESDVPVTPIDDGYMAASKIESDLLHADGYASKIDRILDHKASPALVALWESRA